MDLKRVASLSRPDTRAHEWAVKVGFDQLPKSIQEKGVLAGYKEHLEQELARVDAAHAAVAEQIRGDRAEEAQASRLDVEVEQRRRLYEVYIRQLQDLNFLRDSTGYTVRVVSPPHALARN